MAIDNIQISSLIKSAWDTKGAFIASSLSLSKLEELFVEYKGNLYAFSAGMLWA